MSTATEVLDVDITNWAPGCRMFVAGSVCYIVDADLTEYPSGANTFIRRQTSVFECDATGHVSDLTPDFVYAPGTTAEDAITQLGYTLA